MATDATIDYKTEQAVLGAIINDPTGSKAVIESLEVTIEPGTEIMLITTEGIIIRIGVDDISQLGRVTSGVKLMNLDSSKDIRIASIARVHEEEADEDETEEESSESEE